MTWITDKPLYLWYTPLVYRLVEGFTMSASEDDRKVTGPSWWDVQRAQLAIRKDWGGSCTIEMSAAEPVNGKLPYALHVRVTHHARSEGKWGAETSTASPWPHSDHKTMPGMLLKLLWDLDWKLTEKKDTAEQQAAF